MKVNWHDRVEMRLRGPRAPRVMSRAALSRYAQQMESVSESSVTRWIRYCLETEKLRPVVRGVFINNLAIRPVLDDEAIQHVVPEATVSLQRVLGASGVLNNPSRVITAVVPGPAGGKPQVIESALGEIRVYSLPAERLFAGQRDDRLDLTQPYPVATPERALVDWFCLHQIAPETMPALPYQDIDWDMLVWQRIERLSEAAGVRDAWEDALSLLEDYAMPDEEEEPFSADNRPAPFEG